MRATLIFATAALASAAPPAPTLRNAAAPGMTMPWSGTGSGGYTGNASIPWGSYPECFNGCADAECVLPNPDGFDGCGSYVEASVGSFLQLGGRRVDSSASYHNQLYAGIAVRASGVPRKDVFFTSKVGPYLALGGADVWIQLNNTLNTTGLAYVDLLLIHWPDCMSGGGASACAAPTTEPACEYGAPTYSATACRLATWRAMVEIWNAGLARAIGVSNYNSTHMQEIADAGLPLPSVNQIPYNIYHSSVQADTVAWCGAHGVLVNGYSPFGVTDRRTFTAPCPPLLLGDSVLVATAAAHGTTPANVVLAWHAALGIVFNPRSQNAAHLLANAGTGADSWMDVDLTAAEGTALSARPQSGQATNPTVCLPPGSPPAPRGWEKH